MAGVKGQQKANPFFQGGKVPVSQASTSGSGSADNPFFAAMTKKEDAASAPAPSFAAVVSGTHERTSNISVPAASADAEGSTSRNPFEVSQPNLPPLQSQEPQGSRVGMVSQVAVGPSSGPPPPYSSQITPDNPFNPRLSARQPVLSRNQLLSRKPASHHSGVASSGTSLHLKGVSPPLNNRDFLLEHFSKFGEVENITCNIKKMCANISFKTHVSCPLDILQWVAPPPLPLSGCGH
jgi:hypothetical protein